MKIKLISNLATSTLIIFIRQFQCQLFYIFVQSCLNLGFKSNLLQQLIEMFFVKYCFDSILIFSTLRNVRLYFLKRHIIKNIYLDKLILALKAVVSSIISDLC